MKTTPAGAPQAAAAIVQLSSAGGEGDDGDGVALFGFFEETLGVGFLALRLFHELDEFRDGGILREFGDADFEAAGLVHRQPEHRRQVGQDQDDVLRHLGPCHRLHAAQERTHQDAAESDEDADLEGQALVERLGILPEELPLMVCPNGTVLKRPTEVEAAAELARQVVELLETRS